MEREGERKKERGRERERSNKKKICVQKTCLNKKGKKFARNKKQGELERECVSVCVGERERERGGEGER